MNVLAVFTQPDAVVVVAVVGIAYNIWQTARANRHAEKAASIAAKEFQPNGGRSVRDSLDRLEAKVDGLHQRHDLLASRIDSLEEYVTNPPAKGHIRRKDSA